MSVWTLLRAQFRQRKGAWWSVLILSLTATIALNSAISSIARLQERARDAAVESGVGDVTYYYFQQSPSDEDRAKLEEVEEVGKAINIEQITTTNMRNITINGEESNLFTRFQPYPQKELNFPVFNEDYTGFLADFPEPKPGEVYLPISNRDEFSCEVGDLVKLETPSVQKNYRIAGFVENIFQIKMIVFGVRYVYMNEQDYAELEQLWKKYPFEFHKMSEIQVYRSEVAKALNLEEFVKVLGKKTNLSQYSEVRIDQSDLIGISTQMSKLYMSFILIFAGLLFVLALIVIQFHVNASLEEEYQNLGALKAMGCKNSVLRKVYLCFFLSALLLALWLGTVIAAVLMRYSQGFFLNINSLLIKNHLAYKEVGIAMASILLLTMLFVLHKLRKIGKISPLQALNQGYASQNTSSLGRVPLAPSFLNLRLATRQLLSSLGQYISAMMVITCMLFFILTVSSIITAMEPDRMMSDYYGFDFDVQVKYKDLTQKEAVEKEMSKISPILDSYALGFKVLDHEGISGGIFVAENAKAFSAVIEGHAPQNDREVGLTRIMAEKLELAPGDTLTFHWGGRTEDYVVSGTYQSLNNLGRSFGMLTGGIKRLDPNFEETDYNYLIKDRRAASEVNKQLMKKFPEVIECVDAEQIRASLRDLNVNSDRLTALVTIISLVFVVISCYIVAKKIFLRERMEYGVFKSIGMRSGRLRRIFTIRFLLIAIVACVLGYFLYRLLGDLLISKIFIAIGISEFEGKLTPLAQVLPAAFLCLVFTTFAWFISGQIKQVEVRELIAE